MALYKAAKEKSSQFPDLFIPNILVISFSNDPAYVFKPSTPNADAYQNNPFWWAVTSLLIINMIFFP